MSNTRVVADGYCHRLMRGERSVLESAVRAVSEQAAAADALVHQALDAGLGNSDDVTLHAKMLRLELSEREGRPRAGARPARARLHVLRTEGALGRWARRCARPLGALGASAAP
jgi:hypothetical protein